MTSLDLTLLVVATTAAALLGGLLGAAVALAAARSQVRVIHDELQRHLQTGTEEADRVQRLIEARKTYLVPLREAISRWVTGVRDALLAVESAHAEAPQTERRHARERFDAVTARIANASQDLDALRGQLADKDLDDVLEALAAVRPEVDDQIGKLTKLIDVPPLEEHDPLGDVLRRYRLLVERFQAVVLSVNRRIDELLAGA
jgi:hypothetical protein